jgi:hypothetical protein
MAEIHNYGKILLPKYVAEIHNYGCTRSIITPPRQSQFQLFQNLKKRIDGFHERRTHDSFSFFGQVLFDFKTFCRVGSGGWVGSTKILFVSWVPGAGDLEIESRRLYTYIIGICDEDRKRTNSLPQRTAQHWFGISFFQNA